MQWTTKSGAAHIAYGVTYRATLRLSGMRKLFARYEEWRLLADRNADGTLTATDAQLWAEWLFYLPGETLLGTARAPEVSAAAWLVVLLATYFALIFLIDSFDPTFREQRRERRRALRDRRRHARDMPLNAFAQSRRREARDTGRTRGADTRIEPR